MSTNKRSLYFIYTTLIILTIISWNLYFVNYIQHDSVNIADFPKKFETWVAEDLPIPAEDLSILETKNAFVRKYTNRKDGAEVYLYLVYSQNNRKVSHPPEICYSGSGVSIVQNVHDPIVIKYKNLTIPTNRLKLLRKNLEHVSFYWFKVGNKFTANYWEQQFLIALNTLTGRKAGNALIRVSTDIISGNQDKAIENIKIFTNLIAPELFRYLP